MGEGEVSRGESGRNLGGIGGTGGSFAILADKEVVVEVKQREGTATGVTMEEDSGEDLEDYVDEEGFYDDYWVGKEGENAEETRWNKHMITSLLILLVAEMELMHKIGDRHKGMEDAREQRILEYQAVHGNSPCTIC